MIKIEDVVLDTAGNGVHRATVAITEYPSGAPATLYSDNGITQLASNSVLTDEKGQYSFYIPNGRYTVTVSKTGATTVTRTDAIQAYDGSGIDIATGKSFTVLNTITLAGTDGTTITLPSASTVLAGRDAAQTFTGLQTFATGLTSAGPTTMSHTLSVAGPSSFTTIAATGAVSFSSTLGVTGLSTLGSLTVTGAATLASLTVTGAFNPSQVSTGTVTSSALSAFNAGLTATTIQTSGVATLDSAIITNNASVGGTLGVTGLATFNNISVTADVTVGDDLTVAGATSLGVTSIGSTLDVTGASTLAAVTATSLSVAGKAITLGGAFTTSGAFATTLTATGTTTLTMPTSGTLLSTASSIALTQLAQTGATSGQAIVWNGTQWAPATVSGGGGAGSFTTLAASGATTLSSTCDITGATTVGSTLGVIGETRVATTGSDTKLYVGLASTQNALVVYGRASGSYPIVTVEGFDASIGIRYNTKLTGSHEFRTRSGSYKQAEVSDTFNAVNYVNLTGGVTTAAPVISALGSDTNIDLRLTPKGTGMLSTTGLKIDEGSNKRMGVTAAMTAGSITVSTTAVTANSRIFLTAQTTGGTPGALRVSARTAGTSFTITSTSGSDTSTVAWVIMEPA